MSFSEGLVFTIHSLAKDNMNKILVSGLINIETTVKIPQFPLEYHPINYPFWGVQSTISGVAVNVGKALSKLGNAVNILSLVGKDDEGDRVIKALEKENINTQFIRMDLGQTPQAVILYDETGRRQIHLDLKDVQDKSYDEETFEKALDECEIAVLCNINFSRQLLKKAKVKNKIIATDVHVIGDIYDEYNADFMKFANILFMSNENINEPVEQFAKKIVDVYGNDILVIGLGARGALLYVKEDNFIGIFDAVHTRQVVNTIGAGDSLFAAFIYFYNKERNPYEAIKKAMVFASYKIGETGAAQGFLTDQELNALYEQVYIKKDFNNKN